MYTAKTGQARKPLIGIADCLAVWPRRRNPGVSSNPICAEMLVTGENFILASSNVGGKDAIARMGDQVSIASKFII
jgi:hypothetical protein